LAAVTFMDSTGLGALVSIKNRVDSSRRTLVLEQPPERVRQLLRTTALIKYFDVE
jgi:anti-anti-sigma factor